MLGCLCSFLATGGSRGESRNLDSSDTRILEDTKKDIGGSSTGGLKDQKRHWRLEGFMD